MRCAFSVNSAHFHALLLCGHNKLNTTIATLCFSYLVGHYLHAVAYANKAHPGSRSGNSGEKGVPQSNEAETGSAILRVDDVHHGGLVSLGSKDMGNRNRVLNEQFILA